MEQGIEVGSIPHVVPKVAAPWAPKGLGMAAPETAVARVTGMKCPKKPAALVEAQVSALAVVKGHGTEAE